MFGFRVKKADKTKNSKAFNMIKKEVKKSVIYLKRPFFFNKSNYQTLALKVFA